MPVTANLKVQLLANEVVVAESDSSALWHSVFQAMERGEPLEPSPSPSPSPTPTPEPSATLSVEQKPRRRTGGTDPITRFAEDLRLDRDVVEGACGPSVEQPYIHLDRHHWESLRKNTGERGPKAIAPTVLAATLLVLWWKHAGLDGSPTISDVTPVLSTINLPGFNMKRSIDNCRWLQMRGKAISLNPSKGSSATTVARAYCQQEPLESEV